VTVALRSRLALLAALVGLLGCGGGDDGAAPPPAPGDPEVTEPAGEEPPAGATPAADTWGARSPAPVPATEVGAAAFGDRVWVAGGFGAEGRPLDLVQVYDPAADAWEEGPPLPEPRHHAAVVAAGDDLVVVGGYVGGGFGQPTDRVLVLDGDAWVEGPPLPASRGAGAAAWDGSRLVYAGGIGPDGLAADVWALEGGAWEPVGSLGEARDHLGAASDGEGRVWFLGGRRGTLDTNLGAVDVVSGDDVSPGGSLPTPRGGVAGFFAPGVGACLAGGESPERTFDEVECVDAEGATAALPPLELPRHGLGAVVVDGTAYVLLGGPEPALSTSATVEALPLG
jgi:hypothetical protein